MIIPHCIPNIFVFFSHIQTINTYHHCKVLRVGSYGCTQTDIAAIWYCLLRYSVSMVASRFDLRKQFKLVSISSSIALMNDCSAGYAGGKFPAGQGGSYSLVDTLSTKYRSHRCRLLSYSVSMVASRIDLRKQVKLGGAIFPPGVQVSKGRRGPEQSPSVHPSL
ncbi:hypothetical protein CLU79DRAFT_889804 [Phycomyces nitens]|nr:hypothetical protein CLU79DRAFT_889804 [Phycomyces nitens]